MLNYIPRSAVSSKASIKLQVNQVGTSTLTLPKFTPFISEAIDGVNYTFLTKDATTVNVSTNTSAGTSYTPKFTSTPSITAITSSQLVIQQIIYVYLGTTGYVVSNVNGYGS
jgi:hypothetical protein